MDNCDDDDEEDFDEDDVGDEDDALPAEPGFATIIAVGCSLR